MTKEIGKQLLIDLLAFSIRNGWIKYFLFSSHPIGGIKNIPSTDRFAMVEVIAISISYQFIIFSFGSIPLSPKL